MFEKSKYKSLKVTLPFYLDIFTKKGSMFQPHLAALREGSREKEGNAYFFALSKSHPSGYTNVTLKGDTELWESSG